MKMCGREILCDKIETDKILKPSKNEYAPVK